MKTKNIPYLTIIIIIILVFNLIALDFLFKTKNDDSKENIIYSNKLDSEEYYPIINPIDFSTVINNKYLTFNPKTKYIYEGETEEGTEHIEVYVTEETKNVMGVNTLVVWDREWLDGNLIEDTKDWYAQDKEGNVWYFGEESKEIVLGEIVNTEGSWEAGVNGAKPGIIMKANPQINDTYKQEYYKGVAEDMAEVLSLKETITVPFGIFNNCLQTKDWNSLELKSEEYKYYCPEIGNVVLEVSLEDNEQIKLMSIKRNSEPTPSDILINGSKEINNKVISEENAKKIALKIVSGKVTDITIEMKFNRKTYVVEIDAVDGETDVIIDIKTGEVLGIEI